MKKAYFKDEDKFTVRHRSFQVSSKQIRNIFLGLNDGLVETLGALSGFFAAFEKISFVLIAGLTVAVAGAISSKMLNTRCLTFFNILTIGDGYYIAKSLNSLSNFFAPLFSTNFRYSFPFENCSTINSRAKSLPQRFSLQ